MYWYRIIYYYLTTKLEIISWLINMSVHKYYTASPTDI